MKVDIDFLWARLRAPFVSGSGSVRDRPLVLLRIEDADGSVGVGEAAPLAHYHGVDAGDVGQALETFQDVVAAAAPGPPTPRAISEWRRLAVLPAVAAIDMALWDLESRQTGQPVWRRLGAPGVDPVEVNYTIAAADRAGAVAEAAAARTAGFRCVKVKVGLGDDAGRLAAVRAVLGPDVAIRLDANGAWSVEQAVASLRALAPVGIELCEEPVHGLAQNREVANAVPEVPIALDETASAVGALDERVCQAVCLKIAACGGITGLLDAARRARDVGYQVYLASTLDGPLGIAAALHAAVAIVPDRPCGLATLGLFADRADPLPPIDGRIAPPSGHGLGEGLLGWYGDVV
ncbi:MAG TPA: enolase C-terminal domain-like protein [Solirubrobacteraceae bacterium]|nr:enolase C-terminal domain-like protein [Solirubrobacteraceae bacterium]